MQTIKTVCICITQGFLKHRASPSLTAKSWRHWDLSESNRCLWKIFMFLNSVIIIHIIIFSCDKVYLFKYFYWNLISFDLPIPFSKFFRSTGLLFRILLYAFHSISVTTLFPIFSVNVLTIRSLCFSVHLRCNENKLVIYSGPSVREYLKVLLMSVDWMSAWLHWGLCFLLFTSVNYYVY